MTDILETLRAHASSCCCPEIECKAADEIERLRTEMTKFITAYNEATDQYGCPLCGALPGHKPECEMTILMEAVK